MFFRAFFRNKRGNVAIMAALLLPPLAATAGGAIDFAQAFSARSRVQDALDSAALAGATESAAQRDTTAASVFNANLQGTGYSYTGPTFTYNSPNYSGTVTVKMPTSFLGLVGISTLNVQASSTAVTGGTKHPICMLALNSTVSGAISDSAGTVVNASCGVEVNSTNATSVSLSGSARINSDLNCFEGGLKTSGSAGVSPAPTACGGIPDPFTSVARPTVGGCTYNGFTKSGYVGTVSPGVYCGGMNFSNGTITFQPGVYIITNGTLQTSGSASLSGNGVVFYFSGNNTGINFSGGTSVNLTAPSTGTLAGFVFFVDNKTGTPKSQSQLSGGSTIYYNGILYMPGQQVGLSGQTAAGVTSPYTAYVADTFTLSGSSAVNINADTTKAAGPVPTALSGASAHLVS